MFSKKLFQLIIGVLAIFSLAACEKFLNEKKNEEQVIELSDDRLSCLREWPKVIRDFASGEGKPQEITTSFDCLQTSVTYFRQRTKGSMENAYTDEDFRKFFGKYFLKEKNLSPELTEAIMKLKKALIGGSDHYVTKIEIDRLVVIIGILKKEILAISPHMKVLTTEKTKAGTEELNAAIRQVSVSLQSILRQLDLSRSDYSFDDTKNLLAAFAEFADGGRSIQTFGRISEWVPVIDAVKIVFFGERAALSGLREWSDAVNTVVKLYELVLRFHYELKDNKYESPKELRRVLQFADSAVKLVEDSHQMRRTGRLPFKDIDTLIDRALAKKGEKKTIPLSADALKDLYRKVVLGMLDPVRRGDDRGADAIEKVHFVSLRRELNIFLLNQSFVDWIGRAQVLVLSQAMMAEALTKFPLELELDRLTKDSFERQAIIGAWEKFKSLLTKKKPVNFTPSGRAIIVGDNTRLAWTWKTLTRFNVMHGLARVFMLGYGDHRDPVKAGCSESELIRWYADFSKVGIELGAFDPRAKNSGARSFKEASFFSFSGNGDDRVDMDEMFEFISMLVAGGLGNSFDLQTAMEDAGCSTGKADIFKLQILDEKCFKTNLRPLFGKVFANLPGLVKYVSELDDDGWEIFYFDFMTASRFTDPSLGTVESADMRTAVMIMHYVESLFTTYDVNQDQTLSVEEVRAGSPRFASFITDLSPVKNQSFVREAFVALVFLGKKPEGNWEGVSYSGCRLLNWMGRECLGTANRGNILRVFSSLKAELTKPKSGATVDQ